MNSLKLSSVLILTSFFISGLALSLPPQAFSAAATHVVISEVQIDGASSSDDFIELYNPTASQVDLSDYRLVKRTSSGTDDDNIVAFEAGDVIEPNGFFLWCNNAIAASLGCDKSTSGTVANNNSVGLRNGPVDTGELVDSLTFGTVNNPLGEGTSLVAPEESQSVERKACTSSTSETMMNGDSGNGNAEDTGDNLTDFILRSAPEPQNSSSESEDPVCTGGSPSPTVSPTASPTSEPTATPTAEPTETASPTASPTTSPTETPTPEPTESPEPTPTPEPTSTPEPFPFPRFVFECKVEFKVYGGRFFTIIFPKITCDLVQS